MMRRLGIFLFYDEFGIVSGHMKRALHAFRPHLDELLFIANGGVDASTMEGLEGVVTETIIRDNIGFDVWGYKHGIEHVGYDNLSDYDEIVLFNYTFFAPMHDLAEMFEIMAQSPVDFWGLTEYSDPEKSFLQSYFLVSRKSLHGSEVFAKYWQEMPMIKSIDDSLDFHEFRFTPTFVEAGFRYKPYIENEPDWGGNTTLTDLAGLHAKGMPVIKYRAFNFEPNFLQRRGGATPAENFRFVADNTDYPLGEIWDYIISQTPAHVLINNAELLKTLAVDTPDSAPAKSVSFSVTLRDAGQLDLALEYLETVPKDSIRVASPSPEIIARLEGAGYRVRQVSEADIALRAWLDEVIEAAGEEGYVVNLCDFPGERPRYDFIRTLYAIYWGAFLGPKSSAATMTEWLESAPHIGLVFPDNNSVDGRESAHKGLSHFLQGWTIKDLPADLRKTVGSNIWPWRGNAMFRAGVLRNEVFKAHLNTLVPAHMPRHRDVFSGIEALFPEMVRRAGAASSLIVQEHNVAGLISNYRLFADQASERINRLAQEMRKASQAAKTSGKKSKVARGADGGEKLNLTFEKPDITLELSEKEVIGLTLSKQGTILRKINTREFAEFSVDEIDVSGTRLFIRGWVFDADDPQNNLMCGLFADGQMIEPLCVVQDDRPDVPIAFPDMKILGDSGFRIEHHAPEKIKTDAKTYHLVFIDTAGQSAMAVPIAPLLNRGRRHAIVSLLRNRT